MADEWHKCFLCDVIYHDPKTTGRWGYCPSCRGFVEAETEQEINVLKTNLKKKEK